MHYFSKSGLLFFLILMGICIPACTKFVQVDAPQTDLVSRTVFESDAGAKAAIASVYSDLVSTGFASGSVVSISFLSGLSADEMDNYTTASDNIEFADNRINANNATLNANIWSSLYKTIYKVNAIIENLHKTTAITASLNDQLTGEALFIRAFSYFYLVNLFGDVPLVLSTEYQLNSHIGRTVKSDVYNQMIADLKTAQTLLATDYSYSNNERVRVNYWVATALLARVYLYTENFLFAETEATALIEHVSFFSLVPLKDVFLKNSQEAIWQLSRDGSSDPGNAQDAATFFTPPGATGPVNCALKPPFVASFEPEDLRKSSWVGSQVSGATIFYFPIKYKVITLFPIVEYTTVFRLGEQYLIRAEARAQQNKLTGTNSAASDVDVIRARAGLLPTHATDKAGLMAAIEHERSCELFTEWGHRWMDLKRWPSILNAGDKTLNRADDVLPLIKTNWQKEYKLYPIPNAQILNDPAMTDAQNPGYH